MYIRTVCLFCLFVCVPTTLGTICTNVLSPLSDAKHMASAAGQTRLGPPEGSQAASDAKHIQKGKKSREKGHKQHERSKVQASPCT